MPDGLYNGWAFHDHFEGGRKPGRIEVGGRFLAFLPEDGGGVELPIDGIQVRRGGAAGRILFFTHESAEGWEVYTSDHAILNDPTLKHAYGITRALRSIRRAKAIIRLAILFLLITLSAAVVSLWFFRSAIVNQAVDRIPPALEVKLGKALYAHYAKTGAEIDDEELTCQFQRIAAPVIQAVGDSPYPLEFHILQNAEVNMFALPGGQVVVFSGFFERADSAEEVAFVLAHEAAHVSHRHGLRTLASRVGVVALTRVFLSDSRALLAVLAERGANLASLKYSRDFEREADETAFATLTEAGVDPRGGITLFRKFREDSRLPDGSERVLALLQTHPATEERIERLEELVRSLPPKAHFKNLEVDYKKLKERLDHCVGVGTKEKE
ncbi:MAG: M48 family metallopeptidase [Lentisphaeria bacterium]|nr:M48 family metallopeptidase [Lentisphaeria bacterium]